MTYPNPTQDPLNRPSSPDIPWFFSIRPNTVKLILSLPIEFRDLIWNSLVIVSPSTDYLARWIRREREDSWYNRKDWWSYCTKCWACQMCSISEHSVLTLLRVSKSINSEVERWLCRKFKTVAFCTDSCFWEYVVFWQAGGPLRRANEISLRLGDMSEAMAEWDVHAILQELGRLFESHGLGLRRMEASWKAGRWFCAEERYDGDCEYEEILSSVTFLTGIGGETTKGGEDTAMSSTGLRKDVFALKDKPERKGDVKSGWGWGGEFEKVESQSIVGHRPLVAWRTILLNEGAAKEE